MKKWAGFRIGLKAGCAQRQCGLSFLKPVLLITAIRLNPVTRHSQMTVRFRRIRAGCGLARFGGFAAAMGQAIAMGAV
ncbi:MAG: hypothetical protein AAFQ18_07100 [Pseudomonadota bacterium]